MSNINKENNHHLPFFPLLAPLAFPLAFALAFGLGLAFAFLAALVGVFFTTFLINFDFSDFLTSTFLGLDADFGLDLDFEASFGLL